MWSSFKCHNKTPSAIYLLRSWSESLNLLVSLVFSDLWLHFCSCFWAPNMCYRINKCAGLLGMKFDTTPPPIFWPFRICIARKSVIKLRKYITFELNLHLGSTYWNSSTIFTLMVTWGSNNYFVKFPVLLVWMLSEFGINVLQT